MTTTSTDYISQQEFRDYIKDTSSDDTSSVADAITAASREVDDYCGRSFYQNTTTQYFSALPVDGYSLWILGLGDADIATTSGLTVQTGTANDGTYPQTWALNTDFILEPVNQSKNGILGWPYEQLRSIGGMTWPVKYVPWHRDTVKITGTFGWAAVPTPVKQATKILAAMYYKLSDAPLGVAGWGAYGDIRVRELPQVEKLIRPYRKDQSWGVG